MGRPHEVSDTLLSVKTFNIFVANGLHMFYGYKTTNISQSALVKKKLYSRAPYFCFNDENSVQLIFVKSIY